MWERMLVYLNTGQAYSWALVICNLSGSAPCLRAVAVLLSFNSGSLLQPSTSVVHTIPSSTKIVFFHVSKEKKILQFLHFCKFYVSEKQSHWGNRKIILIEVPSCSTRSWVLIWTMFRYILVWLMSLSYWQQICYLESRFAWGEKCTGKGKTRGYLTVLISLLVLSSL